MGASSSNRLGCWRKISLEAAHSWRISDSESWTWRAVLACRNSKSRLMMSSSTTGSIPPCPFCAIDRYPPFSTLGILSIDLETLIPQKKLKNIYDLKLKREKKRKIILLLFWMQSTFCWSNVKKKENSGGYIVLGGTVI